MSLLITVLSDEATLEVQRRVSTRDESIDSIDRVITLLLTFHGPSVIEAMQQLMNPTARPGELMTSFLERLSHLSSQHKHPSPEFSTRRLRSILITQPAYSSLISVSDWPTLLKKATDITNGLKEAGIEISAGFIQPWTPTLPPQSTPQRPSNTTLCAHCGKRGHAIGNCWTRDPSLKGKVNQIEQINAIETRSTSSRRPEGQQTTPQQQSGQRPQRPRRRRGGGGNNGRCPPSRQTLYELLYSAIQQGKAATPNEVLIRELNLQMDSNQ